LTDATIAAVMLDSGMSKYLLYSGQLVPKMLAACFEALCGLLYQKFGLGAVGELVAAVSLL